MDYKEKLKENLDIIHDPDTSIGDTFDSMMLLRLILCAMDAECNGTTDESIKLAEKITEYK